MHVRGHTKIYGSHVNEHSDQISFRHRNHQKKCILKVSLIKSRLSAQIQPNNNTKIRLMMEHSIEMHPRGNLKIKRKRLQKFHAMYLVSVTDTRKKDDLLIHNSKSSDCKTKQSMIYNELSRSGTRIGNTTSFFQCRCLSRRKPF